MKRPPALATWFLARFGSVDDALVGDLYQEWSSGRSSAWFWQQKFSAILGGHPKPTFSGHLKTDN